jgi:parvulin-like peptidyl-prolyl isomerase
MFLKNIVQVTTINLFVISLIALGCTSQRNNRFPKMVIQESPIVALVSSKRIRRDDLWSSLIELGGKTAMDEHVLNIAIDHALKEQGLTITKQEIDNEKMLFATSLRSNQLGELDKVFEMRGYGMHRKSELLFRNAALRKLISSDVRVTESAKRRMFSIIYGVSYPARIIVVPSLDLATEITTKLDGGESFQTTAIEFSIDSSGDRGGSVNPINTADPVWPSAIRDVLPTLRMGEISTPILVDDRWVIVQITGAPIISDVAYEDVEPEILRLSKLAQERFLMEQLSSSLIEKQSLTIFDDDVKRALRYFE